MKTFIYFNLFTFATASSLRSGKSRHLAEPVVFEGNPNCQELGYDFGWKTPDDCTDAEGAFSGGYLEMTGKPPRGCETEYVGNYAMDCKAANGEIMEVDITPQVNLAAVLVKGGIGGLEYKDLVAYETYAALKPAAWNGKPPPAISHIEYCFRCGEPVTETAIELEEVVDRKGKVTQVPKIVDTTTSVKLYPEEPAVAAEEVITAGGAITLEGNPKCIEMEVDGQNLGYDFGWKTPNDCSDYHDKFSAGYLELTQQAEGIDRSNCNLDDVGHVYLECDVADQETKTATIRVDRDVTVFVKGGTGGLLYNLKAGETYKGLNPGNGKAISHIEWCFKCELPTEPVVEEPAPEPEPEPEPVVEEPAPEPEPEPVVEEPAPEPEPAVREVIDTCCLQEKDLCTGLMVDGAPAGSACLSIDDQGDLVANLSELSGICGIDMSLADLPDGPSASTGDLSAASTASLILPLPSAEKCANADSYAMTLMLSAGCGGEGAIAPIEVPFTVKCMCQAETPAPTTPAPTLRATTAAPTCDKCAEMPEMKGVPADKIICPALAEQQVLAGVTALDTCGSELTDGLTAIKGALTGDKCNGQMINTWTASVPGCSGDMSVTKQQIITVKDDEAPAFFDAMLNDLVFTCPQDFNMNNLAAPEAADNCCPNVPVVASAAPVDSCNPFSVTWTATDECGNEAKMEQLVTFTDKSAPVLDSPAPAATAKLSCGEPMPEPVDLVFLDNCAGEISVPAVDSGATGDICSGKTTVRTWSGPIDSCGNAAADVIQTFVEKDEAAPSFDDPLPLADVTNKFECKKDYDQALLTKPSASDDCGVEVSGVSALGKCGATVTWTAEDVCGKTATASQAVPFSDSTPPKFIDETAEGKLPDCAGVFMCPSTFSEAKLAPPAAGDNCLEDVDVSLASTSIDKCSGVATWKATDSCGNEAEISQDIVFGDKIAPALIEAAPVNKTLKCNVPMPTPSILHYSDNCGLTFAVEPAVQAATGDVCSGQITMINYEGPVDECENKAMSYVQQITVLDQEAPVLPLSMDDIVLSCPSDFPSMTLEPPMATDDCCAAVTVTSNKDELTADSCNPLGLVWTAVDDCGKEATVGQTVRFTDNSAPVLESPLPVDEKLSCGAMPPEPIDLVFRDNCVGEILAKPTTAAPTGDYCSGKKTVRSWSGPADQCGNKANDIKQVFTEKDEALPSFVDTLPLANVVGKFECKKDFMTSALTPPAAEDDCTSVSVTPAATLAACSADVTWTATDGCGNSVTANQKVEFSDSIPPSFDGQTAAQALEGTLPDCSVAYVCPSEYQEADIPIPAASDNCGADVDVSLKSSSVGACGVDLTFEAMDECGNAISAVQKVTFSDSAPPALVGEAPKDVVLGCQAEMPVAENLIFEDNCGASFSVAPKDGVKTGDVCTGFMFERTWDGPVDECANAADMVSQKITVLDQSGPEFVLPALEDVTLICPGDMATIAPPAAKDDCTADVKVEAVIPETDKCAKSQTLSWLATDECGKTATIPQNAIFTLGAPPTISCPLDNTISATGPTLLSPVISTGDCFDESDLVFTITPSCNSCEFCDCVECDDKCSTDFAFDVKPNGDLEILDAPIGAAISYEITMDWGCGTETIQCSANAPIPQEPAPAFVEYSGNIDCEAMGYDFGYKTERTSCVNGMGAYGASDLEKTGTAICDTLNVGSFWADCSDENAMDLISTVDVAVFMKAGNGGLLYDIKAGTYYSDLIGVVGGKFAISHVEFCFNCPA